MTAQQVGGWAESILRPCAQRKKGEHRKHNRKQKREGKEDKQTEIEKENDNCKENQTQSLNCIQILQGKDCIAFRKIVLYV